MSTMTTASENVTNDPHFLFAQVWIPYPATTSDTGLIRRGVVEKIGGPS